METKGTQFELTSHLTASRCKSVPKTFIESCKSTATYSYVHCTLTLDRLTLKSLLITNPSMKYHNNLVNGFHDIELISSSLPTDWHTDSIKVWIYKSVMESYLSVSFQHGESSCNLHNSIHILYHLKDSEYFINAVYWYISIFILPILLPFTWTNQF
jgi:hypothetical protein